MADITYEGANRAGQNESGQKVICPDCGHHFEIKKREPLWLYSEEGQEAQKAINLVKFWTKINSGFFSVLGVIVVCLFAVAISSTDIERTVGYMFWYIFALVVWASGVIFLFDKETKLFRKLMQRTYPKAFNW